MAWSRSDDLDGSPAEQVLFGFDGQMYAIDLGAVNLEKMGRALQPFLTVAQAYGDMPEPEHMDLSLLDLSPPPTPAPRQLPLKAVGPGRRSASSKPRRSGRRRKPSDQRVLAEKAGIVKPVKANTKPDFGAIRSWANENGYTVGPTGRIPSAIMEAYKTQTSAL